MESNPVMRLALGLAAAWLVVYAPGPADADSKMIVKNHSDADYVPLIPERPEIAQIAVLRGDPDTGPSAMLLKMAAASGRLHTHSSDYHLVVIEGTMKHWKEGEDESAATALGPGSYWYQPRDQAHADSCLSDTCVMFIKWEGPRDVKLAE